MLPSPKLSSSTDTMNLTNNLADLKVPLGVGGGGGGGGIHPITGGGGGVGNPNTNSISQLGNSLNSLNLNNPATANLTLQSLQSAAIPASAAAAASVSLSGSGTNVLPKTATFLNQLEVMMSAVKKEASALESMKLKLKEMDELRYKYAEVKKRLQDTEEELSHSKRRNQDYETNLQEMRQDMQKLNDLYTTNHMKFLDLQSSNQRMEHEITHLKSEKEFLIKENEKIPELKKQNKTYKIQLNSLKTTYEEEKKSFTTQLANQESNLMKLEKSKNEISQHVYSLTEEIDKYKQTINEKNEERKQLEQEHDTEKRQFQIYRDRSLMIIEDLKNRYEIKLLKIKKIIPENSSLTIEMVKAQQALSLKAEEYQDLSSKHSRLEEKYAELKQKYEIKSASAQEIVQELTNKVNSFTQENTHYKQKLVMKQNEIETLTNELTNLKQTCQSNEQQFQAKEMEMMSTVKTLTQQRDDVNYKYTTLYQQYETLSQQQKADSSKYWEELHHYKNLEHSLQEEKDKLANELSTLTVRLHHLETEKLTSQRQLENKSNDNLQIIATLKEELEKRVNELMAIRQEKELLQEKEKELIAQNTELKNEYSKLDSLMKKTLDNERNKMKQELLTRNNRIKNLEQEKGELLHETQELMAQVAETQKEMTLVRSMNDEKIQQIKKLQETIDTLRSHLQERSKEIESYQQFEKENQQKLKENHHYLQQEIVKYETILTDQKKNFSQQLLETNTQLHSLLKEIDAFKAQLNQKEDTITSLEKEKEKYFQENNKLSAKNQEINQSYNNELNHLRKDLQEYRSKLKITQENKTLLEKEMIHYQMTVSQAETEIKRITEQNKTIEQNYLSTMEKVKHLSQQNDSLQTLNTQLTCKIQEIEAVQSHKQSVIDNLNNNLLNLEKDSVMEMKRLKLIIQSNENELNELKTTHTSLTKEMMEYKNNYSKLQSNNSSTMNNILEEMKKTEELLLKERKVRQQEQDNYYSKQKENEMNYELLQKQCQEISTTYRTDCNKLEVKIHALETENDRYKLQMKEKDLRVEELENGNFTYRKKLLESKERLDSLETELQEFKNKYENEATNRKRLEQRVRQLSEDSLLEGSSSNVNVSNYIPPRSRGSFLESVGNSAGNNGGNTGEFGGLPISARGSGGVGGGVGVNSTSIAFGDYNFGNSGGWNSNSNHHQHNNNNGSNGPGYGLPSPNGSSLGKDYGLTRQQPTSFLHDSSSNPNLLSHFPSSDDSYQSNELKSSQSIPTLPLSYQAVNNGSHLTVNSDISSQATRMDAAFRSPGRNSAATNAAPGAASPAVDRVSAALALKLAQQTRSFAPSGGAGGGIDNKSIGSNNNAISNGSSGVNRFNHRPVSSSAYATSQYANTSTSSVPRTQSFAGNSGSYNDDILATDYDNTSANSELGYSSVYPSNYPTATTTQPQQNYYPSDHAVAASSSSSNPSSNSVEESIRRAQMMINRKLGKNADNGRSVQPNTAHFHGKDNAATALNPIQSTPNGTNSSNNDKTPNSGRSASKLHESIQQAHHLYPPSPSQSFERGPNGTNAVTGVTQEDHNVSRLVSAEDDHQSTFTMPQMKPMSPPRPTNLQFDSGGSVKYDDYLNGINDNPASAAVGGVGVGKKKKKAKKVSSTASNASNSTTNSNNNGNNDPSILPKINKLS